MSILMFLIVTYSLCRPPVGLGQHIVFTDVAVSVIVTPITKGICAQMFLGGMFSVP